MSKNPTYDPKEIARNERRAAVRVTAEDLQPGDQAAVWNDKSAHHLTVDRVLPGSERVLIHWTDGTQGVFRRWQPFHRKPKTSS